MLVIRLARVGKKKQPEYRVVVADKRRAVAGRFIEIVGHYQPLTDPATIRLDRDEIKAWMEKGAQPSETVRSLIRHVDEDKAITNKPKNKKKVEPKAEAPKAEAAEGSAEVGETAVPAEETPAEAPAEDAPAEDPAPETPEAPAVTPDPEPDAAEASPEASADKESSTEEPAAGAAEKGEESQ